MAENRNSQGEKNIFFVISSIRFFASSVFLPGEKSFPGIIQRFFLDAKRHRLLPSGKNAFGPTRANADQDSLFRVFPEPFSRFI